MDGYKKIRAIRKHLYSMRIMPMFTWSGNSCFLDTVFWVLFAFPGSFVDRRILRARLSARRLHRIASCSKDRNDLNERSFLEFQSRFRKIAHFLRYGKNGETDDCSEFRRLYRKWHQDPRCPLLHAKEDFESDNQNEAQEFLQFLLSLYGMNGRLSTGARSRESFFYGRRGAWRTGPSRVDRRQSIIWSIPHDQLAQGITLVLEEHVQGLQDNPDHDEVRTVHTLETFADLLIISLERAHPIRQTVSHRHITIPPTLTDSYGKTLEWTGVICHQGETIHSGHYVAYARSRSDNSNNWCFYDDLLPCIVPVSHPILAPTRGVLFFYS